MERGKGNEVKF